MTLTALDPFIIWLFVGLVAGLAAHFIFARSSVWRYLAAGVVGAVIVSYLIAMVGIHVPIADWIWRNVTVASLGALSVIFIARVFD